ncbi:MAG: PKD domain-containing protein [gamma proteobacterium symbiont of Bathyaustriella thionipta]|nr:PKD domain-containing protein [gamma proteobacterium symbiont of Bathyaustriella thionipta]
MHWFTTCLILTCLVISTASAGDREFNIRETKWDHEKERLEIKGVGVHGLTVVVTNTGSSIPLGTVTVKDEEWKVRIYNPASVPCNVTATQSDGRTHEKSVKKAPKNCTHGGDTNSPPTANANGPYTGTTNIAVNFSSAGSMDADGSIASYMWDFGDGNSSNDKNPTHTYNTAGTYTVKLMVMDNQGATANNSTTADISDSTVNMPPTANANGPYAGITGNPVNFSSAGSMDPDGSIASYVWNFGDGNSSTEVNPGYAYTTAGAYTVTLMVTDNNSASHSHSTTANITDEPIACTSPITEHCDITEYTGPEVCVACHMNESVDMHGSVHYQQGGDFPDVTNIPMAFASAGKQPAQAAGDLIATAVNTYCGTVENSPRFTCAGCHVGNGRFPMAQSDFNTLLPDSIEAYKQLANIDCLTCHQEVYKRFPDWTENGEGFSPLVLLNLSENPDGSLVQSNGDEVIRTGFAGIPNVTPETLDFQFLPAGSDTLPVTVPMAPMSLTTLAAAQNVHKTTRKSCLNCHATSGGGDGTKRGDMTGVDLVVTTAIPDQIIFS